MTRSWGAARIVRRSPPLACSPAPLTPRCMASGSKRLWMRT
ncbi:hypothetical protein LF41_2333 [Lysobacter dokdonensis DS-58]|uniref:Uncharacterized protein n=1 Tax=Lysobacter dokdonensis DS-58 TaxID=1300345 RepID=A0A0A2WNG0_9GAMM|nr:hypothetical protein LF41_2333 [Lysobacter dokdonensis DS-58]